MRGHAEFDDFAEDYDRTLNQGLAFSGEDKDFYARERVKWLSAVLAALGERPRRAIDFGCGTGSATPHLMQLLELEALLGIDVSARSIEVATRRHAGERTRFATLDAHEPGADCDLAFCNGVFHHIPLHDRAGAVNRVFRSLRPGGVWAFWENNPLNPGTQWLMRKLPFDRDAVKVSAFAARRMLRAGGFRIVRTDHLFLFPKFLAGLRPLERRITRLPLGAQYLVLAQKPL
jgi:SAM-dependent methyltransferase